jgi:putative nucleotidyltransferase with HDIG domain
MNGIFDTSSIQIVVKSSKKNKFELKIDECMPGMEIAETIYNNLGAVIISENTTLEPSMLKILKKLGIEKVKIFDMNRKSVYEDPMDCFKAQYIDNLVVVKDIIQDLFEGKSLDQGKVNTIIDSVSEKAMDSGEVLKNVVCTSQIGEYINTHCLNVSIISMLIAKWLRYSKNEMKMVAEAGLLHDIGKAKIGNDILNKPSSLSEAEFGKVKKHGYFALDILNDASYKNQDICMGVLMHHEREDGSGYGSGLKDKEIHEFAKIIAVADVFDAMSSDRVYRKREPLFNIFDQMETNSIGSLNKKIVMTFLEYAPTYYLGERFFLSNGEIGEIVFIDPKQVSKPLIKIRDRYIDLSKVNNIKLLNMV